MYKSSECTNGYTIPPLTAHHYQCLLYYCAIGLLQHSLESSFEQMSRTLYQVKFTLFCLYKLLHFTNENMFWYVKYIIYSKVIIQINKICICLYVLSMSHVSWLCGYVVH
jgi:hypothetical protein